jgi:hypothetical protein
MTSHFSSLPEGSKALWALLTVYESLRPGITAFVPPTGFTVHKAFKVPNRCGDGVMGGSFSLSSLYMSSRSFSHILFLDLWAPVYLYPLCPILCIRCTT